VTNEDLAHDSYKKAAVLKYKININEGGNALTLLSTYPFSETMISMLLTDDKGSLVAQERTTIVDDKMPLKKDQEDMTSYIELHTIA
jgi:hypothetical protein